MFISSFLQEYVVRGYPVQRGWFEWGPEEVTWELFWLRRLALSDYQDTYKTLVCFIFSLPIICDC